MSEKTGTILSTVYLSSKINDLSFDWNLKDKDIECARWVYSLRNTQKPRDYFGHICKFNIKDKIIRNSRELEEIKSDSENTSFFPDKTSA